MLILDKIKLAGVGVLKYFRWDESAKEYRSFTSKLGEHSHGLRTLQRAATVPEAKAALERLADSFTKLTRRAPREYQVDDYDEVPKDRIVKSIKLIKNHSLVGSSAWDTVVKW
jgi:hypothetical protein